MSNHFRDKKRYYALSDFLKQKFNCRVFKVSVNAGFTCPNRDGTKGTGGCIYCSQSSLISQGVAEGAGIKEQIERGIEYAKKRHGAERFLAYFQINSNTYAEKDVLKRLYTEAIEHPLIAGVAVSTRPDCIDKGIIAVLSELSEKKFLWLELGLQSAKDSTLNLINRCHTVDVFTSAVELARDGCIPVCAHIILGLPGETRDDMLYTARFLANTDIWGIKLHNLHVHSGTKLEEMYRQGKVRLLDIEEYASIVVDFLEMISPETVIHRLCTDTSQRFLIAPSWSANKFMVIDRIHRIMEERDTQQGAKYFCNRV
ncbi:MAG: TIGR01212 family radical SAM protein [Deltaproteobacteria bacterium GWC2_42_11]|nr:MAG: TIGR01212 family radical SAM protein [Deltaproteobacteria bacterium GWC2_42_11]HBO84079.1 TIGR01212 family radical SAM protein [Deltaproteobacteria bacterium]